MSYYKKRQSKLPWSDRLLRICTFLSLLFFVWIVMSNIADKSPSKFIKDQYYSIVGNQDLVSFSPTELQQTIASNNERIDSLSTALYNCENRQSYRIGMIDIESETVNVRSDASLTSDIVLKIPNTSEVEILFFDTKKYYLEGVQGQWCKIKYAGQEGWVWGNFIRILE